MNYLRMYIDYAKVWATEELFDLTESCRWGQQVLPKRR